MLTDPYFYAIAAFAVLLLGIGKSGFGAGLGSLAVPLMAITVPVPQAAAILMPVLLLMDILGVAAFRREVDWRLLRFLLPCGLLGTAIGAWMFSTVNARQVAGLVGIFTLLFLAQRVLVAPFLKQAPIPPRWMGAILTTVSGFTSFVAHAGGPPVSSYLIPMRLKPIQFTATLAFFFFAVNLSKWIPYAALGLIDGRNMATSLLLLPLAPVGVWLGLKLAKRISEVWFYRCLNIGMALTGLKLVWDGYLAQ